MQASTVISVRANAVLIALCIAVSDAACLAMCVCSGRLPAFESTAVRMTTLASAAVIVLCVRRLAKRAFESARDSHRMYWMDGTMKGLVFAVPRNDDWLVQLHVELHPAATREVMTRALFPCNIG
ncbi:hypothetical protein [Caballeronia cordobensis]|uniref:hypothetical protein n=1 Tax=Caballeronia cordobensis TaxID=1353886 RepID=UPI00045F0713|nr:uncharacterized protein BRPE67_CCDS07260 [Burkholderia sp. RPE67]